MDLLNNYPYIKEDLNAKSLSYNFKEKISFLDVRLMTELKKTAIEKNKNLRISLHASPEATLHNMIILQHKNTYNRPHCHKKKAETYHLIEGTQTVFLFDGKGNVLDRCDMSKNSTFIYRFEEGYYHMSIPTSDLVIFHESKVGPFIREGDSVFPSWAPLVDSLGEVQNFIYELMKKQAVKI